MSLHLASWARCFSPFAKLLAAGEACLLSYDGHVACGRPLDADL